MRTYELNEVLSNETIKRILKDHSVPCYTFNEKLLADDMTGTNTLEDLTGYTVKQLRDWLGY